MKWINNQRLLCSSKVHVRYLENDARQDKDEDKTLDCHIIA